MAAQPQDDEPSEPEEERHARIEQALEPDEAPVAAQELLVGVREALELLLLLPVRLDDADAREGLLRNRAEVGELRLDLLEPRVNGSAEVAHRQRHERQRDERDQGQSHVDREHQPDGDNEQEDGAHRIHQGRSDHHAHGAQVAGRAGHQVAGPVGLIEGQRQALEVPEEVVADVVLDVARRADDDPPHEEAEDAADDRHADGEQRVDEQLARGDAARQVVDRMLQNPGAGQLDTGRRQRADQADRDRASAPAHIRQQADDRGMHHQEYSGPLDRPNAIGPMVRYDPMCVFRS